MPAERHPTLFTEFTQTPPVEFPVVEPHRLKASSLISLTIDKRRGAFEYDGPVQLEVDIPLVIRKFWRLGKDRVGIYNGSVNPLGVLRYNNEEFLRELSLYFGGENGRISIPVGSVIEGFPRKNEAHYKKELELVRVVPPSRT
ncbi:MAG TPA: hypothetical protein VFA93_02775 [Patescibacteria group bacterium]|nr:hypothetical protein [Patescibacteria group bacterium]